MTQTTLPTEPIIDPATAAVIAVDVQRAFTDLFRLPLEPALDGVLRRISRVVDHARTAGATVAMVRTVLGEHEHSENTRRWPEAMRRNFAPGSPGTEFDPSIAVLPGDIEIVKARYSAFLRTPLDSLLRERGVSTAVIVGLTTNVCVQSTARDAWQHDYTTITLADCCSEVGTGAHDASLEWTARNFGFVCRSDELVFGAPRVLSA